MARIRSIKPEFWGDEKLAPLPPLTRLVFLGLISMADDAGRLVDNVKAIDGFLFPETEDSARDALAQLAELGRIRRYVSASGQRVMQIVGWARHQKIDHPGRNVLPPEPVGTETEAVASVPAALAHVSREPREYGARPSRLILEGDLGSGPRSTDQKPPGASAPEPEKAPPPRKARSEPKYPHFPPGDCDALYAAWEKDRGSPGDYARFRKALAVLYKPTGPLYPLAELVEAVVAHGEYVDTLPMDKRHWESPERFTENVHRWVELGRMPYMIGDKNTERGALLDKRWRAA